VRGRVEAELVGRQALLPDRLVLSVIWQRLRWLIEFVPLEVDRGDER
jgi:hypothetical protein